MTLSPGLFIFCHRVLKMPEYSVVNEVCLKRNLRLNHMIAARRKNLLAFACLFTFDACLFMFCACLFTIFLGANHEALILHVTLWWICS